MLIRRRQEVYGNTIAKNQLIDNNGNTIGFHADNKNSTSLKFKQQTTRKTGNGSTNDVEIMVTFKYLRIFENA